MPAVAHITPQPQGLEKRKYDLEEEADAEAWPAKAQETSIKHEVHWALDGNLLLQIGNTRFKVHRSRLASESAWFQALIESTAGQLEDSFIDQAEIDKVVGKKARVGELDLFYLDLNRGPSAEDFAALLMAMTWGIEYVYDPPDIETIALICRAAVFFRVSRYVTFASSYLQKRFPDTCSAITAVPSLDPAQGIILGREFELDDILRPAFYDLARSFRASLFGGSDTDLEPIKKLHADDVMCLLDIQSRLSVAWYTIGRNVDHKCSATNASKCDTRHRAPHTMMRAEKKYPFDPISGIDMLLKVNWESSNEYCAAATAEVLDKLKNQHLFIWEELWRWIC